MDNGTVGGVGRKPHPHPLLVNTVISQPKFSFITHFKVIVSGKLFEVYEFDNPIIVNRHIHNQNINALRGERTNEFKDRNVNKARNRIRRLVQANFDKQGKFLTLDFKNTTDFDITSLDDCHLRFANFMRLLRYKYHDFRYVAVVEFQDKNKRGAVHYHLMVDIPFTPWKELMVMWKYGGVYIERIDNPACVGAYISKYVSKALKDKRYKGHRCFYSSKNLKQPVIKYGDYLEGKIGAIESKGYKPTFEKTYTSEWCGEIKYQSYNLYNPPAQKESRE